MNAEELHRQARDAVQKDEEYIKNHDKYENKAEQEINEICDWAHCIGAANASILYANNAIYCLQKEIDNTYYDNISAEQQLEIVHKNNGLMDAHNRFIGTHKIQLVQYKKKLKQHIVNLIDLNCDSFLIYLELIDEMKKKLITDKEAT